MAPGRTLPSPRNPLLADDQTPPHDILVPRRRLGQTDLSSQAGTVGLNDSTKPENLGIFDYAHLRVPLPKDLKGSGIFAVGQNSYPESYFLMRRSTDGFISATGMFKAAYPWASLEDEHNERLYHKSISSAGKEEVAGSVWISPTEALDLATDYGMRRWIIALLDPEKIEKGTKDLKRGNHVSSPPKFNVSELHSTSNGTGNGAGSSSPERASKAPPVNPRKRELRSASPTKQSPRKIATPRKRRAAKQASVDPEQQQQQPSSEKAEKKDKSSSSSASKKATTHPLENGTTASDETPEPSTSVAAPTSTEDVVRITADETVERENSVEVVHTTVRVEMPVGHPELPLPEDTEEMVRLAQEMVAQAKAIDGADGAARGSSKRKAEEVEDLDDEVALERRGLEPAAKRQKVPLAETLKKERVRSRTALGLAATIALGSAISYFF